MLEALAAVDLPPRQVADLRSAVRSLCRVLGQPPAEVPADPGVLGRALRRALPAAAGIAPRVGPTSRAWCCKALALTGCQVLPGRSLHPLTPAWAALDARLPDQVLPGRALAPDAFLLGAGDRAGRRRPGGVRSLRSRRSRAIASSATSASRTRPRPGCGTGPSPRSRAGRRRASSSPATPSPTCCALEAFPASFQADVELWLGRLAGDGLLDEGPVRPLRPRSLEQRRFYLRQAASALVAGRPRSGHASPASADLVTVEAMQAILRFFLARSGNRPTSQIHGLATHLKAIARHHVGVTPAVLEQLGRMVRRVAPPQTGLALKNRLALQQFEDPELLRAAGPAAGQRSTPPCRRPGMPLPPRTALRFQWALAVQLLLVAPMRLGNLAGLELGRHLLRIGSGKRLRLPAS